MYDYRAGKWEIRTSKSKSSIRNIPLTKEAVCILKNQKEKVRMLDIVPIGFYDFVFLSKNVNPIKNSTYNKDLQRICKNIGLVRFSMHTLRHTFATRCAESGMNPKTLQKILGHANISVTMDIYVHATEDNKSAEMKNIAPMIKIV